MLDFIISLIPVYLYLILRSKKSLHMLQQNYYNGNNRYLKWVFKNKKNTFNYLEILPILGFAFFLRSEIAIMYYVFIAYSILTILYLKKIKKEQVKKPLVVTSRVKRLIVTVGLIYTLPLVLIISLIGFKYYLVLFLYSTVIIPTFLVFFIIWLANIINKPIEKMVANGFYRKAKKTLKGMPGLKKIGITGSYGKTSSKNIINDILSTKFLTTPSPLNYNTTMGLVRTVNENLDKFSEVFIAEMGAFRIGDIKELCDFVEPQYGVLTTIGVAHLEIFGSRENIQKGKFELIESLPSDGIGILNMDDKYQTGYDLKNDCKIVWIAIDNKDADIRADKIKIDKNGMTFTAVFKDKTKIKLKTKLLGRANIYNILAGVALGYEFGLTPDEIELGVKKVEAVSHRLELKNMGDINLIDDSYNSNPVGAKMALEVLELMPGKKIVVTPGMIDLARDQDQYNFEFGTQIAEVADEVILVGKKQTEPIYNGLIKKKYKKKQIHVLNDVKDAFPLLQELKEKETYVLLENDLPDLFNEE